MFSYSSAVVVFVALLNSFEIVLSITCPYYENHPSLQPVAYTECAEACCLINKARNASTACCKPYVETSDGGTMFGIIYAIASGILPCFCFCVSSFFCGLACYFYKKSNKTKTTVSPNLEHHLTSTSTTAAYPTAPYQAYQTSASLYPNLNSTIPQAPPKYDAFTYPQVI